MLEVLDLDKSQDLERVVDLLRAGEVVACPTETVFGLLADARNPQAVDKVYAAKGRDKNVPLSVVVSQFDFIEEASQKIWPIQKKLVQAFWPGPLSILFKIKGGVVAKNCIANTEKLAARIPSHKSLLKVLYEYQGPLVCPSANRSGEVSASSLEDVQKIFTRTEIAAVAYTTNSVPVYRLESTLVEVLSGNEGKILRLGALSKQDLQRVSGSSFHWQLPEALKNLSPRLQVLTIEEARVFEDWQNAKVLSVYPVPSSDQQITVLSQQQDTNQALKDFPVVLQRFLTSLEDSDRLIFIKGEGGVMMEALNNRILEYLGKALR